MKFGKKLQHQLDHSLPEWKPNFLCYKLLKKRLKQLGRAAPMAFLQVAIMDRTHPSEDGVSFLMHGDGQQKRKSNDEFLYEVQKKRKGDKDCIFEENNLTGDFAQAPESGGEEQEQSPRRPTENDEHFLQLLKTELHKFNAFFLEKEEEFLIRLSILEEKTDEMKERRALSGSACERSTHDEVIDVQSKVVTLHGEMVLLMNYSSLNYVGLLKILKKYDKVTKSNLRQLICASLLQQQPFFSIASLKKMVARSLACEDSLRSLV
jgi:SPX domain protein involved in polyphosphate accumulation